jgi:hypothetical protein
MGKVVWGGGEAIKNYIEGGAIIFLLGRVG